MGSTDQNNPPFAEFVSDDDRANTQCRVSAADAVIKFFEV
jgi:hypothetical protein